MTSMSQTTNQAAMVGKTIELQGLDASWDRVTQTKALHGSDTTGVITLDTPMIRCFRMKVLANVVSDQPIRCHNAAENQDYAIIGSGNNQTLMAISTVPNGYTGLLTNYYTTVNPGVGAPTTLDSKLWFRDNEGGYAKQIKHSLGVNADVDAYGYFRHHFEPFIEISEKSDVFITVSPSGASVDVSAGFDMYVVQNSVLPATRDNLWV